MTGASSTESTSGHEGPLAEFVALRQEILARQDIQHKLLTLQLTLSGAVFGFALSGAGRSAFLLILPISSFMLFGRYAAQHAGNEECGRYIRDVLSAKVPGGLHWETWIQSNERRRSLPLIGWLEPLLVNFSGVAFLALAWCVPRVYFGDWSKELLGRIGLISVWVIGLVLALSTVRLLWHVRRRWWLLPRRALSHETSRANSVDE